ELVAPPTRSPVAAAWSSTSFPRSGEPAAGAGGSPSFPFTSPSVALAGPCSSMTWAVWTRRSQIESAIVGSPISSCQPVTGTWVVRSVEARSLLEDLEHVLALDARERGQAPVADHQQVGLGQPCEQARIGAVAAGDMELMQEP